MYKYETHLHTFPVSKCARVEVRPVLEFYRAQGFDGVFITNHFLDGNINIDPDVSYEERINFYFSDYEFAKSIAEEVGIKVFCGVEMSYLGTDFLVYGLDKNWYLEHPEIIDMPKSKELPFLMENGALVIQAHPFREARYIDHIRLFPRCVHGVEIINANRTELENAMAEHYAKSYDMIFFAGSDNHSGDKQKKLAGMCCDSQIKSEQDFINKTLNGELSIFSYEISE